MNETMIFDEKKTQVADATQMVMEPQSNATQFAANVTCPVCETPNPPSETYCIDCGFMLSSAPVAVEDMPKPQDLGKLITTDGTREFILKPGENCVGRENADILLSHNTVSRKHAKITVLEGQISVEDLGSTNGTFVDGKRLSEGESVEIKDANELMFGSMTLKYEAPLASIDEEVEEPISDDLAEQVEPEATGEVEVEAEAEPAAESEPIEETSAPAGYLVDKEDFSKYEIAEGTNTIGRRDGNDIIIGDPYVSGSHAELVAENGIFTITDIGSTNGTFINGVRLEPNQPRDILDSDEVTIGRKIFKIEVA